MNSETTKEERAKARISRQTLTMANYGMSTMEEQRVVALFKRMPKGEWQKIAEDLGMSPSYLSRIKSCDVYSPESFLSIVRACEAYLKGMTKKLVNSSSMIERKS